MRVRVLKLGKKGEIKGRLKKASRGSVGPLVSGGTNIGTGSERIGTKTTKRDG